MIRFRSIQSVIKRTRALVTLLPFGDFCNQGCGCLFEFHPQNEKPSTPWVIDSISVIYLSGFNVHVLCDRFLYFQRTCRPLLLLLPLWCLLHGHSEIDESDPQSFLAIRDTTLRTGTDNSLAPIRVQMRLDGEGGEVLIVRPRRQRRHLMREEDMVHVH